LIIKAEEDGRKSKALCTGSQPQQNPDPILGLVNIQLIGSATLVARGGEQRKCFSVAATGGLDDRLFHPGSPSPKATL
jgi:hypothetical protein